MTQPTLVLASTSSYRKQLLEKLSLPFITVEPNCDETPQTHESAECLVQRLAEQKARSCKEQLNTPALIIGSDQVCVIDGDIIGKPHTRDNAISQLSRANGRSIQFYTGVALYNTTTAQCDVTLDIFTVHFRHLSQAQIEHYVDLEQPFNCAGSFKSEGLGIALFERLEGKDPNALIGLPLITLIGLLAKQGVNVL